LYWRYESLLKEMDSRFKSLIGANGSIFLIKKELFGKVDPQSVDDFERTLEVLKQGYLALYEPRAMVLKKKLKKPVRRFHVRSGLSLGVVCHAAQRSAAESFSISCHQLSAVSHKLLRWLIFVFVLTALLSSGLLAGNWFYRYLCLIQIAAYLLGAAGLIAQSKGRICHFLVCRITSCYGVVISRSF
jgi:hypothetical protein